MCGVLCLLSIRGVTVPAMLVLQFRLSKDRIRLEVSSRLVTAYKVPIAIDTLSNFIFLGNLQISAIVFSAIKDAILGNTRRQSLRLKFPIWCSFTCLDHSDIK